MLFCPHCASQAKTLSDLLKHIRATYSSDPSIVFQCNLQGCKRTFKTFHSFQNHIYLYHSLSLTNGDQAPQRETSLSEEEDIQGLDEPNGTCVPPASDTSLTQAPEVQLKRVAILAILKSREVHRIPMSIMDEFIADTQSLFTFAIRNIRERVSAELSAAEVAPAVIQSATQHLEEASPLVNIYHGLSTQHLQNSFLEQELNMVVSCRVMRLT